MKLTLTDILMRAENEARSACGSSMVKRRDESEAKWLAGIRCEIKACRKHLDAAEKMMDSGKLITVFAGSRTAKAPARRTLAPVGLRGLLRRRGGGGG